MKNPIKKANLWLLPFIMVIAGSCHSEYIRLTYSVHHGACWNNDSTEFAAIISSGALRPPKGISRFPDGGTAKTLFTKVALYRYDAGDQRLYEVADFSDLARYIGPNRLKWDSRIAFIDSLIYYQIQPTSDWDFIMSFTAKTKEDSINFKSLQEKYSMAFFVNTTTGEMAQMNMLEIQDIYERCRSANLTELNRRLTTIPVSEIGLRLSDITNRSEQKLIEETIYLENQSVLTRRAVVEQIISQLNPEEIEKLLEKMDRYKSRLSDSKRAKYERNSEELYQQIKELL